MQFAKLFDVGGDDQVLIRISTTSDTVNVILETFVGGAGFRTVFEDCKMKDAEKAIDDYDQNMAESWYQEVKEMIS